MLVNVTLINNAHDSGLPRVDIVIQGLILQEA